MILGERQYEEWVKAGGDAQCCDVHEKAAFLAGFNEGAGVSRNDERIPTIVCLCGSTRFVKEFNDANLRETLKGKIVLSIGCNLRSDQEIFGHLSEGDVALIKDRLDELHKRKIDLADEVLILNVGGYIGSSTRSELDYAIEHGKTIRYWEGHE